MALRLGDIPSSASTSCDRRPHDRATSEEGEWGWVLFVSPSTARRRSSTMQMTLAAREAQIFLQMMARASLRAGGDGPIRAP